MTLIRFDTGFPDGAPRGKRNVLVVLVDGGAGGSVAGKVVGDTAKVHLDAAGLGEAELAPNDGIAPPGTFYRCTLERSSPPVVRLIQITAATPEGTSWADESIQVVDVSAPSTIPVDLVQVVAGKEDQGVAAGLVGAEAGERASAVADVLAASEAGDAVLADAIGLKADANDPRLADTRTPTDATVTPAKFDATAVDPAAGVAGARTLGSGTQQAAPGASTAFVLGVLSDTLSAQRQAQPSERGISVPMLGLPDYLAMPPSVDGQRHIVVWGDSCVEGASGYVGIGPAFQDAFSASIGQPVSAGFQGTWRYVGRSSGNNTEWAFAGSWTQYGNTGIHNNSPMRGKPETSWFGSSIAEVGTWTKPAGMKVDSFDIWTTDITGSGVAGNAYSYSIDGGAWTAGYVQSGPATSVLRKFTVNTPITSNLRIRCATAAGANMRIPGLHGIEVRRSDASWCVHNLGMVGASVYPGLASSLAGTTTGYDNWKAWFTDKTPALTIQLFTNDTNVNPLNVYSTTGANGIAAFLNGIGDFVTILGQERINTSLPAVQLAWRDAQKAAAGANGGASLNLFERWGTYAESVAAGLQFQTVHPTTLGSREIASSLLRLLRSA